MTTPSNTVPDSLADAHTIALAEIPPIRLSYWSIRRELWESRSIYLAPLPLAGLFLVGFLISMLHLPKNMRAAAVLDPLQQREFIAQPYNFVALLIMGTTFLVAIFYCLDALHGERRDRSILFWKSLPVSDLITVLSKASIPIVVLPLLTFTITVVTQWIMLLISTAVLLAHGMTVAPLWTNLPLFQMSLGLFFHLLAIHGLWYAPIFGWLLLVSAWARRAVFLWAALPLVAVGAVEKMAFNTSYVAAMLMNRVSGGAPVGTPPGTSSMDSMAHFSLGHFLASPGLWIGLALTAAFLVAAVRIRKYQGPI
jgi:ABC-2 type transport system permease protein